jgi:hypothetical protein
MLLHNAFNGTPWGEYQEKRAKLTFSWKYVDNLGETPHYYLISLVNIIDPFPV